MLIEFLINLSLDICLARLCCADDEIAIDMNTLFGLGIGEISRVEVEGPETDQRPDDRGPWLWAGDTSFLLWLSPLFPPPPPTTQASIAYLHTYLRLQ
eukprot:scaffold32_cov144-Skeletonema_menzelii.AAC.11